MIAWLQTTTKKINRLVITIILIIFYFLVLGIIALFYKLSILLKTKNKPSYWLTSNKISQGKEYFLSPY